MEESFEASYNASEGTILCPAGAAFQQAVCGLSQLPNVCPKHGAVSPIAKIHRPGIQGVEKGESRLTTTPNDPLVRSLLLVPVTLCSADRRVSVPKGGMLPSGDTKMIPLGWERRLLPSPLGSSRLSIKRQRREIWC